MYPSIGRGEDSGTSTISVLSEVVKAVGGKVPILVDSGLRRGKDVAKALAMGATAVGVRRPYSGVWGLLANQVWGGYWIFCARDQSCHGRSWRADAKGFSADDDSYSLERALCYAIASQIEDKGVAPIPDRAARLHDATGRGRLDTAAGTRLSSIGYSRPPCSSPLKRELRDGLLVRRGVS